MSDVAATNAWVRKPQSPSGRTRCDADDYERMYTRSIEHSEDFWAEQGARLDWFDKPTKIAGWSYDPVDIRWFEDGIINICHNAVDRHVAAGNGDRPAMIFEPDDPDGEVRRVTYADLQREIVRMANTLKTMGVEKGDSIVRHLLEMGRLDLALRVGRRNVPDPEVIGEDEHNVGQLVVIRVKKAAREEQRE